jgi:hypothetical protein
LLSLPSIGVKDACIIRFWIRGTLVGLCLGCSAAGPLSAAAARHDLEFPQFRGLAVMLVVPGLMRTLLRVSLLVAGGALAGCSESSSSVDDASAGAPAQGGGGFGGGAGGGNASGGGRAGSAAASGGDSGAGGTGGTDPSCVPLEQFEATGFFNVTEDCGRWWFVTPEGERFYSAGVNTISVGGDHEPATDSHPYGDAVAAKYESPAAWAEATATRLKEWGWNTVGSWSSWELLGAHMPYTVILGLSQSDWQEGNVVDYFAPEWVAAVDARVAELVPARADDPNLIGWFIDNEMRWGPDWRDATEDLFDAYLRLDAQSDGKRALISLVKARHADVRAFNNAWGTDFATWDELAVETELPKSDLSDKAIADRSAFLTSVAHRFFSTTVGAIRAADPNHLVLGVRFVSVMTPREVARVSGKYLDVVSVNNYEFSIDPTAVFDPERFRFVRVDTELALQEYFEVSGRPLLITEFGFRAADSGLPNSWPPIYPTLETQLERADRLEAYAERVFEAPYLIGYHWFEFADQPPAGRFDGEDNNWGLVDINDDAYAPIVERSAVVNRRPYEACFATPAGCD